MCQDTITYHFPDAMTLMHSRNAPCNASTLQGFITDVVVPISTGIPRGPRARHEVKLNNTSRMHPETLTSPGVNCTVGGWGEASGAALALAAAAEEEEEEEEEAEVVVALLEAATLSEAASAVAADVVASVVVGGGGGGSTRSTWHLSRHLSLRCHILSRALPPTERVCCLLVLNSGTSTPARIHVCICCAPRF